MSAISGIWERPVQRPGDVLLRLAGAMADSMAARGPDSQGGWHDVDGGIALAYRGLAPGDRGRESEQPFTSSCGRFVLACDGEIYNRGELIADLRTAGLSIAEESDMAAVAEGAAVWGVEAMVRRLNGSFAGALWDREQRVLYLFRDRFGTRPLYYADAGRLFLFASELKGLRACAEFRAELDRDVLAAYMRWRSVPNPLSIYRGAAMLQPGSLLRLPAEAPRAIEPFWELREAVLSGQRNLFAGGDEEAIQRLDRLLRQSVRQRMGCASVGVLLSGGIDSSLILALAKDLGARPPIGFTVGYRESDYGEFRYAEAVAKHLGAEQHTFYVTPDMARDVIPSLPDIFDEPNADISQIPAYLLSQMIRRHVGVAFTGDGAAEPVCGVPPYHRAAELYERLQRVPLALRQLAGGAIRSVPPVIWNGLGRALPGRYRTQRLHDKLDKLARVLTGDYRNVYRAYRSYWLDPENVVLGAREATSVLEDPQNEVVVPDLAQRIHYIFSLTTSIDSVTAKAERAASAAGLQLRMPFFQPAYVDFGWSLPVHIRLHHGEPKWPLRELMRRYYPDELVDRKRGGFDIPLALWLRGPLRGWAEDLLDARRLRREGIFNPREIQVKWRQHCSGARDWAGLLWVVLTFQAWKERWLP